MATETGVEPTAFMRAFSSPDLTSVKELRVAPTLEDENWHEFGPVAVYGYDASVSIPLLVITY